MSAAHVALVAAGILATLLLNVAVISVAIGKFSGSVAAQLGFIGKQLSEIKDQLSATGDNALIRRSELAVIVGKASSERETMNVEIGTLRETSRAHGELLAGHEARLSALEVDD